MYAKEIHLSTVKKFHDEIEHIDSLIDNAEEDDDKLKLLRRYRHLIKAWQKFDNAIDTLKSDIESGRI